MMDATAAAPPRWVLSAFGVEEAVERLEGGQGSAFASRHFVFKPALDEEAAVWSAETQLAVEQRGFRLARPIASNAGAFVVGGWSAWSRLRGAHRLKGGPWPRVVELCARFHEAFSRVPRPAFLHRRQDYFARADRIAWNEDVAPLTPDVRPVVESLVSKLQPSQQPPQLIHADFAGNVLFEEGYEPAVIDLSPYFRPASYALALTVVDAVLWYGGSLDLLDRLHQLGELRPMVARALAFRLAIDGLVAVAEPGGPSAAAIQRDLLGAGPLLQYLLG